MDHSVRRSMKNAANCDNSHDLQTVLNELYSNAHCAIGFNNLWHICLRIAMQFKGDVIMSKINFFCYICSFVACKSLQMNNKHERFFLALCIVKPLKVKKCFGFLVSFF